MSQEVLTDAKVHDADALDEGAAAVAEDDVEELLVEEISIDGMCGVY